MAAITTTGTLTAGNSRTFALAPGSALTLTLLPNCRVTVTETPETVSASDAGGNSPRTHNHQLAGVVTYGPYAMGGSVVVDNASNSGSTVTWGRKDTVVTTNSTGTSLVSGDGNWYVNFATPNTIALFGDSLTRNNHWDGAALKTTWMSQLGYFTYARQLLNQRFYYDYNYNFGVFGDTTTQMLARIDSVIAVGPSVCVVLGGINDLIGGETAATVMANLTTIWARLNSAGIKVIAGTIFPASIATLSATEAKRLMQVNQWMRATVPTLPNVYLWDSFFTLSDLTSSAAGIATNCYASDLLHIGRKGSYLVGVDLAAVIEKACPGVSGPTVGAQYGSFGLSDAYDATDNPYGNLLGNNTLVGTAGSKSGANVSGNVATGYTVYQALGSVITAVCSKNIITLPNGQTYEEQQIAVTSAGGGVALEEINFQRLITTVVGDIIIAGAYIDVSGITGRVNYISGITQAQYGSYSILSRDGYYGAGGADGLPSNFVGTVQTLPAVTPSGGTSVLAGVVIGMDCTVAGGVTVKIRLPYARKMPA